MSLRVFTGVAVLPPSSQTCLTFLENEKTTYVTIEDLGFLGCLLANKFKCFEEPY
jgi:hypothetical protein